MEYTPEQIQERLDRFVQAADKVRELKDYLLSFRFMDSHQDWLEEELARHDEAIEEIGRIYNQEMIPLVQEMSAYLEEHKEDFQALVEESELEGFDEEGDFSGIEVDFEAEDQMGETEDIPAVTSLPDVLEA